MLPKVTVFLKTQGLLWLGDLYTAFRLIMTGVILALLGITGWFATQGELVNPVAVLVNPEVLVDALIEVSFPNVTICDPEGQCFTLMVQENHQ